MKGKSIIVAAAAGAFLFALAGISQASGSGPTHRDTDVVGHWGPVETGTMPSSDVGGQSEYPGAEFRRLNALDTVEHWGPVEIGALPGTDGKIRDVEVRIDPSEMGKPTAE